MNPKNCMYLMALLIIKILMMRQWKLKDFALNLRHLDDIRVNSMRHGLEATAFCAEAGLFAGLALGAAVAVNALWVITFQSEPTGRHASNSRQDMKFLPSQLAVMIVIAVLLVGAFPKQEVIIA